MRSVTRPARASAVSASMLHGMCGTHAVARFAASAHSALASSSSRPVRSLLVSLTKIPMRTGSGLDARGDLLEDHRLGRGVHLQEVGVDGEAALGERLHHLGLEAGPVV